MRRLVTVALVLSSVVVVPASGQASEGFVPTSPAASTSRVTLVTGDQVEVTTLPGGRHTVDVIPRDGGGAPSYLTTEQDGDLFVIPEDVRTLVPQRLDPALFNVSKLVEQGYDDDASKTLPLIVSHRGEPQDVPAAKTTEQLESIDSTGVRVEKDQAGRLGKAIARLAAAQRPGVRTTGPLAGVEKIWLDRKVEVELDASTGQIGAPTAWAAGYTGAGVTVAVLDSGIDTSHPDLEVGAERNFTFDPDAGDGFGHGTHVASIIAGTGAASDGARKGVAYGATLINGKVLTNDGWGFSSWIVEAMEWAAAEQDADIVNLSLGVDGFGSDPVAQAVDSLTDDYGTLFVVAAGNGGCHMCVTTPGVADAALTVGAVDRSDRLADFSSRGPLKRSFGIKPDVTAPGVDIVAARAAGTGLGTPVGESYTTLSGTSMATPHVAGAAAVLLQAKPDLAPGELKAWLMGSAVTNAANTVYEQGAGRIDLRRALAAPVLSDTGSAGFGHFPWPHDGRAPQTRTITYRNVSEAAVTVDLEVDVTDADGQSPPLGTVAVEPRTTSIAPGGTAEVTVTLDTTSGAPGLYGGYVVARSADGAEVRTPVGYNKESKRVNVRLRGIARDGRPAGGYATVLDVDDGSVNEIRNLAGDPTGQCTEGPSTSTCVRVPPGTYSVMGYVLTLPASEQTGPLPIDLNKSLVGYPEIEITHDTEIVLDARKATEVLIDTPDHRTKRNLGAATHVMYHRAAENGVLVNEGYLLLPGQQWEERLFLQPTEPVTKGEFAAYTRWRLEAPEITLDLPSLALHPQYYRPDAFSDFSREFPRLEGRLEAPLVYAGTGRDLEGLDGKIALIQRSDDVPVAEQSNNAAAAGAAMVAIYNDGPGINANPWPANVRLQVPTVWLSHEEGIRARELLAGGAVRARAEGVTASPYIYDLVYAEERFIPETLHYDASVERLARVDSDFHSQLADDISLAEARHQFQPWETYAISESRAVAGAPRGRVDYVTAGPSTRWSQTVSMPEPAYNNIWPHEPTAYVHLSSPRLQTYDAGERYRQSWFRQPLAPGVNPYQPITRDGDIVKVSMAAVDSRGNFGKAFTSLFEDGLDTELRVYHGDEYIGGTKFLPSGWFRAVPDEARYRIEYDIDNNTRWGHLSTRTKSVWSFVTQRPAAGEQRVEPLLLVDYDLDVDRANRHPRDGKGPNQIGLTVRHQAGAPSIPLTDVSLAVSYDDGRSWKDVGNLRGQGAGRYVAELDNRSPQPTSGFVSLRVTAEDLRGNRVEQEVIRAYGLR